MDFIACIEKSLGKKAVRKKKPLQSGDVLDTHADVTALEKAIGFAPRTSIEDGVAKFVEWYRAYYNVRDVRD